ncbi:ABC transporter ATP-binding protein [Staphylococcus epidermidis]|jgi:ATP-binding cassette subfamily B protein AbcA/BmrA|uniref:ATP-binding cassette transporter A n=1 Tax=Staphylococcus epidermidis (strain ATCC 12228 / FDA PCI 1200) TaxID=176280 RepID=A0A0H2VGK1_STAES|nr:ABC transporter ATP-binding protein [Staphylococcus epidermidis]EHQ77799.1 ABC transporter transmembrane region [Staphylococcus epidermidis VCU057]AAO04015.1 ATP-binding cassette transporter A [Staphylococcus epidermidis ATCC 12228]EHQ75326.1 ABC transporter transmembrane region [Staphylococcus epidermidis VCU065]KAB1899038.1 ABC transporter ATP-binding protein [Staphylococcus epidermidis ATCC 12228]MBM6128688.1 ABC transporter ATP-binding protein [Staphylococcus epidermidis]
MKEQNPLFFLFKRLSWPYGLIIAAVIITSLGSLSGLLVPLFTGRLVDKFSVSSINWGMIAIFGSIFLVNALLSGIGLYLLSKIGEKIIYAIRSLLWEHIIQLKMPFFDKNESGQLMSRLTDDTKVINEFISQKLPNLLPSVLTLIGSLVMLFIMDWKLTLLTFITIPVFILIIVPLGRVMQKISTNTQSEIANFSGLLGRVLTEMRLVKVSNTERLELDNAHTNLKKIYRLGLKQAKISAVVQPISGVVMLLTIAIILGFGALEIGTGAITPGTLIAMIFYVIQLSMPLINLSTLVTDYKKAVGASSRIYEIMQEPIEPTEALSESKDVTIIDGELVFEHVDFKYDVKKILEDVSFSIPQGEVSAFVGPSGSGKSTIFNLIERMYDIERGDIKYGNQSIFDIPLSKWRTKIGYVMQSNSMMSGTIRDNILYGINRKVDDEELIEYAKLANCHDFIIQFDEGYDTMVGERGLKLSGGQRQRIDIARSFVKNPDILLLDEATANLDSESELKIQEALETLMEGRTTVVIAHRLSTIKKAGQIVFIDKGEVTGKGTHHELMASHDKYRHFVTSQKLSD